MGVEIRERTPPPPSPTPSSQETKITTDSVAATATTKPERDPREVLVDLLMSNSSKQPGVRPAAAAATKPRPVNANRFARSPKAEKKAHAPPQQRDVRSAAAQPQSQRKPRAVNAPRFKRPEPATRHANANPFACLSPMEEKILPQEI